jgi:uncharacterized protein (TIGR03492 family)
MDEDKRIILFTGNCFGENRSGGIIARELKGLLSQAGITSHKVMGASLICPGDDYVSRGVELLTSGKVPPSGGFPTRSIRGFFSDIFGGAFGAVSRYKKNLRKYEGNIELVFVVGDVALLWLTKRALRKTQLIFFAPAKSDYIEPHYKIELRYIKKTADFFFTHDEFTAENLKKQGVSAEFLGNPMLDDLDPVSPQIKIFEDTVRIAVLPGSREEAYRNFIKIIKVADVVVSKREAVFYAALPSALDDNKIRGMVSRDGFEWKDVAPFPYIVRDKLKVYLCRGIFPDILHTCDLVIGLAGTANEQAAGLGKPIVSFTGAGPQTTVARIAEQERLLGGALKFVKGGIEDIADEVVLLIDNPDERKRRGRLGINNMGKPGGALRMAEFVMKNYIKHK